MSDEPLLRTYMPVGGWRAEGACYACGGTRRWRRADGGLVCDTCHPRPPGWRPAVRLVPARKRGRR